MTPYSVFLSPAFSVFRTIFFFSFMMLYILQMIQPVLFFLSFNALKRFRLPVNFVFVCLQIFQECIIS